MAQLHPDDILADFAHRLRQPLSALEALTAYLDLITAGGDPRVQEHLQRMHSQIGLADQSVATAWQAHVTEAAPQPAVVDELTRPLTKAAIASVTN